MRVRLSSSRLRRVGNGKTGDEQYTKKTTTSKILSFQTGKVFSIKPNDICFLKKFHPTNDLINSFGNKDPTLNRILVFYYFSNICPFNPLMKLE